jgi:hypothetical protein
MVLALVPRTVGRFFGLFTAVLASAGLAVVLLKYVFNHGGLLGFSRLFDLNEEANVPSFYSATILLISAVLLWVTGWTRQPSQRSLARGWYGLSAIFVFLAFDEAGQIHEMCWRPLHAASHSTGALYFAWVIPYGIFVVVVGLAYLRFLAALTPRTRWLVIASGVIYVSGALGLEMVEGIWFESHGLQNLTYALMTTLEETMEMVGISLFIYTLVDQLAREGKAVELRFGELSSGDPSGAVEVLEREMPLRRASGMRQHDL